MVYVILLVAPPTRLTRLPGPSSFVNDPGSLYKPHRHKIDPFAVD